MTSKTTTKTAKSAAKISLVAQADTPAPTSDPADQAAAPNQVKLRDLVARVTEVTGGNKKAAREVVEATLAQLGAALTKGEELNLPGLGKVRVAKSDSRDGRSVMTLKMRSTGPGKTKEGLAEAGEDS